MISMKTFLPGLFLSGALALSAVPVAVHAESTTQKGAMTSEHMSGEQIRDRILGHGVQGTMADGQSYNEHYGKDGRIQGDGYTGRVSVEGDQLCFEYGEDEPTCYQVRSAGENRIEWLEGGEVVGTGEIIDQQR